MDLGSDDRADDDDEHDALQYVQLQHTHHTLQTGVRAQHTHTQLQVGGCVGTCCADLHWVRVVVGGG